MVYRFNQQDEQASPGRGAAVGSTDPTSKLVKARPRPKAAVDLRTTPSNEDTGSGIRQIVGWGETSYEHGSDRYQRPRPHTIWVKGTFSSRDLSCSWRSVSRWPSDQSTDHCSIVMINL